MGSAFQIIQVVLIRGKWRARVREGGLTMETEGQNQRFEDADTAGVEAGLKLQITGARRHQEGRANHPLQLLEKAWF